MKFSDHKINKLFSVIISTYNRPKLLRLCLRSLVRQRLDRSLFEILVIDNLPDSKLSSSLVSELKSELKHHDIIYKLEAKPGISPARNTGAKIAKGLYLAFIDDDATASKDWLETAVDVIKKKQAGIFGGPIKPWFRSAKPDWFKVSYETRTFGKEPRFLTKNEYLSGSNIFISRKIFNCLEGFSPDHGMMPLQRRFGEETLLQQRFLKEHQGLIWYEPTLTVSHLVPVSKMSVRYSFQTHYQLGVTRGDVPTNFRLVLKTIHSTFMIVYMMTIGVIFRNRHKFPAWQNYAFEAIAPKMFWLGVWRTRLL